MPHVTNAGSVPKIRGAAQGHFRLSSGLHSAGYLQCALVLQDPADAELLGRAIATHARFSRSTVVLSPALGGVIIGHESPRSGHPVASRERQDSTLMLAGFTLSDTDRVLVIEDVLTTGGSTRETMQVAAAAGSRVVGAASIVDRSAGPPGFAVPFHALLTWTCRSTSPMSARCARKGCRW